MLDLANAIPGKLSTEGTGQAGHNRTPTGQEKTCDTNSFRKVSGLSGCFSIASRVTTFFLSYSYRTESDLFPLDFKKSRTSRTEGFKGLFSLWLWLSGRPGCPQDTAGQAGQICQRVLPGVTEIRAGNRPECLTG